MRYFSHDTTASMDEHIIGLRITHGGAAVDAYWMILERIYEHERPLTYGEAKMETMSLMMFLAVDFATLDEWVQTMCSADLLELSDDGLMSARASENIEQYQARANTARNNGKKGGRKPKANRTANRAETDSVPTGNQVGNQDETETEPEVKVKVKGMETHKGFPIPCAGAGGDEPAPSAEDTLQVLRKHAALFKAERDMEEQNRNLAQMEAEAVPCPARIAEQVREVV